jgi:hypothetical protein
VLDDAHHLLILHIKHTVKAKSTSELSFTGDKTQRQYDVIH